MIYFPHSLMSFSFDEALRNGEKLIKAERKRG